MAEAVGEEAARSALAAYDRGGCCDEHLEEQLRLSVFMEGRVEGRVIP